MDRDNPGPLPEPAHRWALMAVLYGVLSLIGVGAFVYDAFVQKERVDLFIVMGTLVALAAAVGNWQVYRRTKRRPVPQHVIQ
ncbi:hypothetical protein [Schleiferilactobacillus shenzhenensis]|nr:hypothetical protein [Schleiferilactobacillus shenzhenensis]